VIENEASVDFDDPMKKFESSIFAVQQFCVRISGFLPSYLRSYVPTFLPFLKFTKGRIIDWWKI
jgi:hypothetical protein